MLEKVLEFIDKKENKTDSCEISKSLGIEQQEVKVIIQHLENKGWLAIGEIK